MNGQLKILFLEDVLRDAELNWLAIERKGISFERLLVDNRKDFLKGLKSFKPDIIISDYSLPQFDGMKALLLRNEITPFTPFIIVTGSVNEEVAVECMKAGADDYVIKDNLTRLPFAVKEALEKRRIKIEKMAADLLLKENEEKLQSIFRAAPVGIGLLVNNILIEANDTFCKMTGYNLSELIGEPAEMIFASDEQNESFWQLIYRQIAENGTGSGEMGLKCKDGRILTIILSSSPLDKVDLSKGVTFIAMDITERAQTEEALANEKYLIYSLMNTLPDHIYFKDLESRFIRINKAQAQLFGLSDPKQALGKTDFDFFTEQHALQAYMDEQTILRTGQPIIKEEMETHHNIPDTWVSTVKMPLHNSAGNIIGTFGISRDITIRKKIEEELLNSKGLLERLNQHQNEIRENERALISREVHDELGQSMTALKLDLFMIKKYLSKSPEALIKLESMVALISDTIKTVQRISSDLRPGILDDLGLVAAIEWYCDEFKKRTGIQCTLELDECDFSDSRISLTFFRILQEALTNVIRHSGASAVNVKLHNSGKGTTLTILDNGVGVAKEKVESYTSLGLINIRERVREFNGNATIVSKPGEGTKVTVFIP